MEKYIIKFLAVNSRGVIARLSALIARKGFNIESFCAGHHIKDGESSIVITFSGSEGDVQQAVAQMSKLINIISAEYYHEKDVVQRELLLVKLKNVSGVKEKAQALGGRLMKEYSGFVDFEFVDKPNSIEKNVAELKKNFTVIDISRSGNNAI